MFLGLLFLDPFVRDMDPDPSIIKQNSKKTQLHPSLLLILLHSSSSQPGFRIRIRTGSGFNRASGSGSKRAKMTHKSRKIFDGAVVVRIRIGSGFSQVSGSRSRSGSRSAEMIHKKSIRKFYVLKCWMASFVSCRLLL
jgi:hypothetical protein